MKPIVDQYEYADFSDVLSWVCYFTDLYGPQLALAFERYIRVRKYYLVEKDPEVTHIIECLIKNDVGVRRLQEDCLDMFQKINMGRQIGGDGEMNLHMILT